MQPRNSYHIQAMLRLARNADCKACLVTVVTAVDEKQARRLFLEFVWEQEMLVSQMYVQQVHRRRSGVASQCSRN